MLTIRIPYLFTIIIAVLLLLIGHSMAVQDRFILSGFSNEVVPAQVQEILDRLSPHDQFDIYKDPEGYDEIFMTLMGDTLVFEAQVRGGSRRGTSITASQSLSGFMLADPQEVKPGDRVLLINFEDQWFYNGHLRTGGLFALGIIFALSVLIFGGKKGFNTLLSLGLTCGSVFLVFIPAILSGKNVYLMAIMVCVYTTVVTLLLVVGYNQKALGAAIGCISGIVAAGLIALVMDGVLQLTGIIIGAMGAIMDVAMSIASSLWELREKARTINFQTLFKSGLNIGRDILGSMANTLILAYIGSSLSVVLILSVYSNSLLDLLNREMIAVEILQALAGSFGILLALPLTAFFSSLFYLKKKPGSS
ncbi:MAG: YibE/F family protein [Treponema sp.]|nr:YibE/F family protein [Treponema sp.]